MTTLTQKLIEPLRSRKNQVALATLIAAYAGQWGFGLSDAEALGIVGVGMALIFGIAHEDNGRKGGLAAVQAAQASVPLQPLQTLTAEPIAPAIGAEVAKAVQPLISTQNTAMRVIALALQEIRKSQGGVAVQAKPGVEPLNGKVQAPNGE